MNLPRQFILRVFPLLLVGLLLTTACGGGKKDHDTVRITIDPVQTLVTAMTELTVLFTDETGIKVEIHTGPRSISERLNLYQQMLGSRAARMDLFLIDVIWTGHFPGQFVDLNQHFAQEVPHFFPRIIENNSIHGELMAIPLFTDVGVIFYRRDLLEKYGIDPPETWSELEAAALTIQEGERADGVTTFWGFIWQGGMREALTCNVTEWFATHGVESYFTEDGDFSIDRPRARAALDRAASWMGHISPLDVLDWVELESVDSFKRGEAAFLRYWSFGWRSLDGPGSPLEGKVGVMVLPSEDGRRAGCLGGWQFALSRSSENEENALRLLRFLTSERAQRKLAAAGFLPTRHAMYDDPEMREIIEPFAVLQEALDGAALRPSAEFGRNYNAFSTLVQRLTHQRLAGQIDSDAALSNLVNGANPLLLD